MTWLYHMNNLPLAFSKGLPSELASYFINFFNDNKHKFDSSWIEDEQDMLSLYGLTEPTELWERWCPQDSEYNDKINQLLDYLQIQYTDFSSYIKTEYIPGIILNPDYDIGFGKSVGRAYIQLDSVSIHNKKTWETVYEFLNEHMSALELFFYEYEDFIKG